MTHFVAEDGRLEMRKGKRILLEERGLAMNETLPGDVVALLEAGQKIEAIKRLREQTGLGLKEAKEAVEAHPAGASSRPERLAPGEVRSSTGVAKFAFGLALALFAAWYFLYGPR